MYSDGGKLDETGLIWVKIFKDSDIDLFTLIERNPGFPVYYMGSISVDTSM